MKTMEEIKQEFFAILYELQCTSPNKNLRSHLQTQLELLLWILDEELSEDWQEQARKVMEK